MKKYKLIKEYPGSPPLGTIAEPSGDVKYLYPNVKYIYPNNEVYFESSSKKSLFKKLIENHPEFWEEVVEKDYKILKLSLARSIKHEVRDFEDCSENYIEGLLACKGNYIHSVKRLSDGEIFTVGDKITFRGLFGNSSEHKFDTIKGFGDTVDGNLAVLYHNGKVGLHKVEKYKPLFTTEDGVDIYDGDKAWSIYIPEMVMYHPEGKIYNSAVIHTNHKYFSTKEKAEEYILMNKPYLSINDIKFLDPDKYKFERLKELVKSRL